MVDKVIKETDVRDRITLMSSRLITEGNKSVEQTVTRQRNKNISFGDMSPHISGRTNDLISNQVILESNPTLTRALEILTGLIVCPNGGSVVTLSYEAETSNQDDKYNEAARAVCTVLDDHFTNVIKLQNDINHMVYTALATDGAHITLFIPNSNISKIFDSVGLEAEVKQITEKAAKATLKGKDDNALVTLTYDTNILTVAESKRYLQELKESEVGNESGNKVQINAAKIMRKRRVYKDTPVVRMERSEGSAELLSPIKKNISTIACKPIIFKGEPDNPHGYVFVLDEDGYPVEMTEEIDFDKDLRSMSSETAQDKQIKTVANNFTAQRNVRDVNTLDDLQNKFNRQLEADIFNTITDGTYTEKYTIADDEMISTLMFHRLLRNQKTKLLFVPAHQVSYFCFDTDKYGVGRSLISKTKTLSNIYTVLFYANFIGSLSNAIPHKEVTIDFDKDDIDQNQTFEQVVNELILSKVNNFDFNFNGPSDVMKNIAKHGVEFKLRNVDDGDLPAMNIEVNDKKRDNQPIDRDFMELVSKQQLMKVGFSPEYVDNSYGVQFSAQVAQDNDITSRQISKYGTRASAKITDRVVTQTINDPVIIHKCLEVLSGDTKETMLEEVLANLNVTLPQPTNASINEKSDIIEDNIKVIDIITDTLFPDSMADGVDNMSREHIEGARELTKSYFMQDYIRRNSSFKGLVDKIRSPEGLKSILNNEGDFKLTVMDAFADYAKKVIIKDKTLDKELTEAEDKIAAKLEEPEEIAIDETSETPDEDGVPEVEEDTNLPDDVEEESDVTEEPETPDEDGIPTISV